MACPVAVSQKWMDPYSRLARTPWNRDNLKRIGDALTTIYELLAKAHVATGQERHETAPAEMASVKQKIDALQAEIAELEQEREELEKSVRWDQYDQDPKYKEAVNEAVAEIDEAVQEKEEAHEKLLPGYQMFSARGVHRIEREELPASPQVVTLAFDFALQYAAHNSVKPEEARYLFLAALRLAIAVLADFILFGNTAIIIGIEELVKLDKIPPRWQGLEKKPLHAWEVTLLEFFEHKLLFYPSSAAFLTHSSECLPKEVRACLRRDVRTEAEISKHLDFSFSQYLTHPFTFQYAPKSRAMAGLLFACGGCDIAGRKPDEGDWADVQLLCSFLHDARARLDRAKARLLQS